MKIAIVGTGVSGLVAAHHLHRQHEITVYEAAARIGGHTHTATDRVIGGIRALNPGSTGLPRTSGTTHWLLLEDDGDAMTATHRSVPYDDQAVAADLNRRRHPNAEFVTSLLTGQRQMS